MNNPAERLARLLSQAAGHELSPSNSKTDLAISCGALISEINEFLDASVRAGKEYRFFQEAVPGWAETVFKVALVNSPNDDRINEAIFGLKSVSVIMEQDHLDVFEGSFDEFQEVVDGFKEVVRSSDDLPNELRLYCFQVISSVETELERYSAFGDFDSQKAVERLTTAINLLLAKDSTQDSPRFEKLKSLWNSMMGFARFSNDATAALNGGFGLAELAGGQS